MPAVALTAMAREDRIRLRAGFHLHNQAGGFY